MWALQSWLSVLTVTATLYVNFWDQKQVKNIYKFELINHNVQIIENSIQSDEIMDFKNDAIKYKYV